VSEHRHPVPPAFDEIVATGAAEIVTKSPEEFSHNRSSLYADPVAWLATAAVDEALRPADRSGSHRNVLAFPEQVGVIAVSNHCTIETMRSVAAAAPRGRMSPLQFAGANPGSLAGLVCMHWKFRGPTLTLSTNLADGVPSALVAATAWLRREHATSVILLTHTVAEGLHTARCVVLSGSSSPSADAGQVLSSGDDLARLVLPGPTVVPPGTPRDA
jgi:3-oxoacyl-(acyl-carrier-protein) synthase